MFTLSKLSIRCLTPTTFRTILKSINYSTARPTIIFNNQIETEDLNVSKHSIQKVKEIKSNLVAAAFASLQEETTNSTVSAPEDATNKKIAKAKNINELLTIYENNKISREHALKVVSIIAQWSAAGKLDLSDFESDPRFIKICKILSRGSKAKLPSKEVIRNDDLSMVLGVTGDDEAAKLVASITLPQMIKVMSALAQKKRRSTPLLRSLAYNISRNQSKLDLKQCTDLLYSMTVLNFLDTVLLERISNDVMETLETNNDRSAVIGSLLTSLGLLRYKDIGLLDALSDWILKHSNICRPQDIAALFQTLAVVNYKPINAEAIYKNLIPQLNIADVSKSSAWLDIVWSLVLLKQATNEHISSVLNNDFINKLQDQSNVVPLNSKVKLLNINAAAQYLNKNYNGPYLEENSPVRTLFITRTKDKQALVSSVLDALKSLFSSNTYLKTNVNSGMGFLIDGECVVDSKCNPVPVTNTSTSPDHKRVAILVYDYHDVCKGDGTPHGGNVLHKNLLESQGYKLLIVPYTEFSPRDKLVQRVQFIEKQLKAIASS